MDDVKTWNIEYVYPTSPRTLISGLSDKQRLCLTWRDGDRLVTYPLSKRELPIYIVLRDSGMYGLTAYEISQKARVNYNTVRRILGQWSDFGVIKVHKVPGYKDPNTKLNCYVLSSTKEHAESLMYNNIKETGKLSLNIIKFLNKEFNKRRKFIDKCSSNLHRWDERYLPYYGD